MARATKTTAKLERMDAAGQALRWLSKTLPQHTADPELWEVITDTLDRLDRDPLDAGQSPRTLLARFGLRLIRALGWGLELHRCVRCERLCEEGRSARLDPIRGGLVCRRCGGGPLLLSGPLRKRLVAATEGMDLSSDATEVELALRIVEQVLSAHAGVD